LDRALLENASEVEMVVRQVPSQITQSELSDVEVDSVVGFFETRVSRLIKDKDRTYNVLLGSGRLDGQIIMPGQVFSFNDALGDRSEARGFRYAPVIAGGVLVEGMGGGTCQVASTLNAAAFFSGLVVAERRPHSRPSSYIKLGLDATVSYPSLDLKLKNPFDFPVVMHLGMEDGILRVEFRGKTRPYTVTFLRKIIRSAPFPVRVMENPNLLKGKEVITQNGIPGYTVRRYQVIDHDKVAYRFQSIDKYPPTTQIVHQGTASRGLIPGKTEDVPKADTHNPYRASNYLRMVQGKDDLWYEQSHE
jgi:vancomycin resistance protein YoaR